MVNVCALCDHLEHIHIKIESTTQIHVTVHDPNRKYTKDCVVFVVERG